MAKPKYTVVIHKPWAERQFFEHHPNCTDVENDGPILVFTDKNGVFNKTSAPWTISREPEPSAKGEE